MSFIGFMPSCWDFSEKIMSTPNTSPAAIARRTVFVGLSVFLTAAAFVVLLKSYRGVPVFGWDYLVFALFPLLFAQIAVGFTLALLGFFDWLRGGDPLHVMRRAWRANEKEQPLAATAIVVPVYNENVARVAAGIANMWQSLEKTGQLEHFDFYLCSDSNDADRWVEEECAWLSLCRRFQAFGKIFYRKRRHAINGKSGNVADFCRRWGKRYRYMIVLDADSVMAGPTMVRLVRAMEANPEVGILQTQPYMVLGRSLLRRVLQFSSRAYGSLFSQGCSMAQMASGSYWGHNAIIRVAPFIEHCDLPALPVPDKSRRHVLSHDTVEAALMRRAGYDVWIAYEEPGSWEEGPPNLSDMLTRDRRWCAGNLQHFWFLFARGIDLGSRLQIWIGLMAYLCSPVWLLFLIASACSAYQRRQFLTLSAGPEDLARHSSGYIAILFGLTLALLFAPRVLGIVRALAERKSYGGAGRLLLSALLENLLSVLLAPVLMIFHTLFVALTLLGLQIRWNAQNRADAALDFTHCVVLYGWISCLGLLAQTVATIYLGNFALWLTPIFAGWILAPVLAWLTSSPQIGLACRRAGLFLTPDEVAPPPELAGLDGEEAEPATASPIWVQALLCPYVQAVHLSLVRLRESDADDPPDAAQVQRREQLLRDGPGALKPQERLRLLWDAESVHELHQELWSRPESELHPGWRAAQEEAAENPLLANYLLRD
jgi:membrane glycosyltransferase